ncbi:MAG: SusC/RagA family TonB-linked outer membrane protein, partial [Alistipes sp.]|nr:SusC/RagA family TonB-linked outer membrane protein [Alistipes sp.]
MVRKLVLSLVAVLSVFAMAIAQNKQVSGTVEGGDGQPIAGATVIVVGTQNGTTTNADGSFTVSAPANGSLQVSFIGYTTETVAIAGKTNIKITLHEDATNIDDVVVVAFGTTTKEAFTGSAAVVKSEDIAKTQTSNIAQALVGKAAGVQLSNTSGQPGSAPSVLVRGIGSLSSSTTPLWVVDGIPYDGDLALINPQDIETMTVLKDAASTALYGSRGANGVIMITTKKAKSGDAIVTLDAKVGVNSRAVKRYDYIDDPAMYYETIYGSIYDYAVGTQHFAAPEAHDYANETLISMLGYQVFDVPAGEHFIGTNGKVNPNAKLGRVYTAPDGSEYYLTPDNWEDEAFRTGIRQEYNVNAAASSDRANFYASFGYLNDEGIIEKSSMERYTARLKADYQVKKWLKIGANANYSNYQSESVYEEASYSSTSVSNAFAVVTQVAPIYPLYIRDGQGNIMKDQWGHTAYDWGNGDATSGGVPGLLRPVMGDSNAVASNLLDVNNASEGNSFTGNAFAEFTFLKDFKFTFNVGTVLDETRYTSFTNPYYGGYASSKGMIDKEHDRFWSLNMQQILNYNKQIGLHNIDVMVGHENYKRNSAVLYAGRKNMFSDTLLELAGAVDDGTGNSYKNGYNTEGYFARAQYNYDDKYFVNGSYRRDASSRFHPDNRWGNFWSVGAAWLMHKESFMDGTHGWLDMLKIKASYGSQGNDGIGNFRYTDLYTLKSAAGQLSTVFSTKGNKNITWETNTNLNLGADFSFWHGRLSGSAVYFYRKTTDMLFSRPTAPSMGYASYIDNIGDMHNSGLEVELDGVIFQTKNVNWSVNLNLTHYKNVIDKLPPEKMTEGGYQQSDYWRTEGKS